MMRRVLFLRHGKSSWGATYGDDRDRPLAPRGIEAGGRIGRFLAAMDLEPDVVLSSPALRARSTAELVVEAAGWERHVRVEECFYGQGAQAVLEVVRRLADPIGTALLVGHEPVWSGLVSTLAGGGNLRFPTAALACLGTEVGRWEDLDRDQMELRWLVTPRLLERASFER